MLRQSAFGSGLLVSCYLCSANFWLDYIAISSTPLMLIADYFTYDKRRSSLDEINDSTSHNIHCAMKSSYVITPG